VNPRVHKRHSNLAGLVAYLFKETTDDDHNDAHLVAVWDGAGDLEQLEPPTGPDGRRDVRHLVDLLSQPVHAAHNPPTWTVWHCSIRNAPEDRLLTDPEWAEVARQVMDATGLAPIGDASAVRWIAVRHSPNHIHLAATLVRQDGRTAWAWQDKIKTRRRCDELEQRYGLKRSGPMDRTGHRRPSAAEQRKAARQGRPVTARDELRRLVRAAAVRARGEEEFFALLADAGVLVAKRLSVTNPGEITGYSVALPANTTADGQPVFFGGGKLARDLTLPRLRHRWAGPDSSTRQRGSGRVRVSAQARVAALTAAAEAIRGAADAMTRLADGGNTTAALAVAQAAADTLAAIASTVEGVRGGPITTAAELFDQAARERNGRLLPATVRSFDLRSMARLVQVMGRASSDRDTQALLVLLQELARLAQTLAALRAAQERYHQAECALRAATTLRAATHTTGRLSRPGIPHQPDPADAPPAEPDSTRPRPGRPSTPEAEQHHRGR